MITPVAFANIGYKTYVTFAVINAFMIPSVYFFFPETKLRSLEEMDAIFKKSSSVFDAVSISLKEAYRYDKHGQLKPENFEEAAHHEYQEKSPGSGDENISVSVAKKSPWEWN